MVEVPAAEPLTLTGGISYDDTSRSGLGRRLRNAILRQSDRQADALQAHTARWRCASPSHSVSPFLEERSRKAVLVPPGVAVREAPQARSCRA